MKLQRQTPGVDLTITLVLATVVSLILYVAMVQHSGQLVFQYLVWNLFLAWIPLGLVAVLLWLLKRHAWSAWLPLIVTLLWLAFLPNSFYMVTDFIHLRTVYSGDIVPAAVLFTAFVFTGLLLGYTSLYFVHHELRRRMAPRIAFGWVAVIVAICSFAIYIGRDLRWNSWDVLTNPAGLLFDLSDHVVHPGRYGDLLPQTVSFFVLLLGMYAVVWRLLSLVSRQVRQP